MARTAYLLILLAAVSLVGTVVCFFHANATEFQPSGIIFGPWVKWGMACAFGMTASLFTFMFINLKVK